MGEKRIRDVSHAHEPGKLGVDAMAGQMTRDLKTKDDIPLCMRERGYYIRPVD